MKIPKKFDPIFITNYLEDFMLPLSPFTRFGDPIYVAGIPTYHFFLNVNHNCFYDLGRMKDV
jgi:hypothetical protein